MKKTFLLFLIAAATTILTFNIPANAQDNCNCKKSIMHQPPHKEQMRREFEQRLNLTDKQKEKAKALHTQGREQIKPIMLQIEVKRQEIETVKLSRISEKMQQEKITQLNSEIKDLEKQAQDIRKKNTQEFEKILNKKQKAELDKMKAEGRARFEQKHPARAPFQGLGTPNFLLRPLLPPPDRN